MRAATSRMVAVTRLLQIRTAAWYLVAKIYVLTIQLGSFALAARYYGPDIFGLFTLALATAGLLAPIGQLGMNAIVTREIARRAQDATVVMGTSLAIRALTTSAIACLCYFLLTSSGLFRQPVPLLTLIILIGEAMTAGLVFSFWFEARSQGRIVAAGLTLSATISFVLKLLAVICGGGVEQFAMAHAANGAAILLVFYFLFGRTEGSMPLKFRFAELGFLLKRSLPLTISGLTAIIYLKADQFMIGLYMETEDVAQYAVAARVSEFWYFIPIALSTAILPELVRDKEAGTNTYNDRTRLAIAALTWLGIAAAAFVTVSGRWIIDIIFGDEYAVAGAVLMIHAWGGVFMAPRAFISKWLLTEDLLFISVFSQVAGAAANIALNIYFIPRWGLIGAAWATIIAYSIAGLFSFALFKKSRPMFLLMLSTYVWPVYAVQKHKKAKKDPNERDYN